ncbi:TetR/AcrR family transcriptional regulator [Ruminococcus sp.]|uniref:TetR/AcrR family transcriptional regulator n=1 Tax=Ruminococcus sp. TaxID=41978 RepID=UPI0025FFDB44|nr:TetR/AcrR family transcriptional regulator [Ruminococcus sp.]MBQ8965434.1 TetR/AcrR family transcriptional regulator [Ruminococcus sp.]
MDKRIEKTKHGIFNSFIELRAKKPLERISIKELCELANINKSTFYAHYLDIYNLSDKIESEITAQIMQSIDVDDMINDPESLPRQLAVLWTSKQALISTIFSGSRTQELPKKILSAIISQLGDKHPELADNDRLKIMLTYSVYGGYYAFNENRDCSDDTIIETLGEISGSLKIRRN